MGRILFLGACVAFWVAASPTAASAAEKPRLPEPPRIPKAGANRPDEARAEKYSFAKAAEYLDRAAVQWHNARGCASCHTTYPFLMARPLLGKETDPTLVWVREFLDARVDGWDRGGKGVGLPSEEDEAVTEVVATAATLAFDDSRAGKLRPATRKALDRMWTIQREDGSWDWNKHLLPPQELDEYYGVVYAAIGVGHAPEGYAKGDSAKAGVARLTRYLTETPAPNLHHRAMLLWASTKLDGLFTTKQRDAVIRDLLTKQRKDGGWNLASLGNWKRLDGSPNDPDAGSDGYATGLLVYVLRRAGVGADDPAIRRGVGWLKANQRESGRWFAPSLNSNRAHYNTAAATAYAVMALQECGEKSHP